MLLRTLDGRRQQAIERRTGEQPLGRLLERREVRDALQVDHLTQVRAVGEHRRGRPVRQVVEVL